MDKKKLLIYGGIGAVSLGALYFLSRSGTSAAADTSGSGVLNPAILYTGSGGSGQSPQITTPEVTTPTLPATDTLQGALDLAMFNTLKATEAHYNDNATSLFDSLTQTLANLGGGQTVGNFFVQDGQTYFNQVTTLFNPKSTTPVTPTLPVPIPPPPVVNTQQVDNFIGYCQPGSIDYALHLCGNNGDRNVG